jgi:hypothetical protein
MLFAAVPKPAVKNIVLVHGGFVDGSGQGVYKALKKDGYAVTIVQNPTFSVADDVAVTKRALATQNGPVILVGHSYGGVDDLIFTLEELGQLHSTTACAVTWLRRNG